MTRKTTAHLFSTVNGVVESPNEWQFDAFGAEEGQLMSESIAGVTDVVIGRKLYEEWSQFWPNAGARAQADSAGDDLEPFTSFINNAHKHVVSSTLTGDLEWSNSTLVDGDPVAFVRDLKEQDGGPIAVTGGIDTIRSLFTAGLIDELSLTTHPVVTNQGRRLFDDTVDTTRLELVSGQTTPAGNAILTYRLRQD